MKPLCIDLYCGLGGWAEGLLAEGYDVIGFDIERHDYGTGGYPGQLVLQDVTTLHGSQFTNAAVIVASPPCTEFSYMAMPWSRAKQIAKAFKGEANFPEGYTGSRTVAELTLLFDTCFRLQREASEAAGRYIPMVVENVRGAQRWVGRAKWHFGSYYLWGDVPALMPITLKAAEKFNPDGTEHPPGSWFAIADSKERGAQTKVPGFRFDGSGKSFQSESVKVAGLNFNDRNSPGFNVAAAQRYREGRKAEQDGNGGYGGNFGWDDTPLRRGNSKSDSRKAASAQIAKIPFPLARHIACVFKDRA